MRFCVLLCFYADEARLSRKSAPSKYFEKRAGTYDGEFTNLHITGVKVDAETTEQYSQQAFQNPVTEFDEQLWISMVDHVVVHSKDDIRVVYRDGIEK